MPTHYIPNSPRKGVKGGKGRGGEGRGQSQRDGPLPILWCSLSRVSFKDFVV